MLRTIWVAVHLLEKTCAQEAATGGGLEESVWVPRLRLARVQPVLHREFSEVEPSSKVMGAVGPLEKALTTYIPTLSPSPSSSVILTQHGHLRDLSRSGETGMCNFHREARCSHKPS